MFQRNLTGALSAAVLLVLVCLTNSARAFQATASQATPAPSMVLKGKAPVSHDVLKINLPKPQEADLANGLHLMVLEDHRLPQVNFQILIPGAGGYYDPSNQIGLAQYTAQLMREGTKTRTSNQISQELETIAAGFSVTASLSGESAAISGSALTENLDRVFDMSADILLHPTFPADEWDRAKTRAKAGLQQQRTSPSFLANEAYARILYGDHPAGRVTTTVQALDTITRDAMVEFHRTHYVPDHALIAFAGDITLAEARGKVDAKLGEWKNAGIAMPGVQQPSPPSVAAPKVTLISRPSSVQTLLLVGAPALSRKDADYDPLTVANRVLGGVMGRLFRHLREEKGYTYGISSGFSAPKYRGDWSASTSVRTAVTEDALSDLLAEIADMRDHPVPASEFEDSKRAIIAAFALSLESPTAILTYYIQSWTYGLPAGYWDTYADRISAVTAEQAQAAARKYWDASNLHIVAVGDAKIAEILKKKGLLEMFDADGKPLSPP